MERQLMRQGEVSYSSIRGYRYRLEAAYVHPTKIRPAESLRVWTGHRLYLDLRPDGALEIMPDYCWDGASGPAINTADWVRASLVHDALYQLMRTGKLGIDYRAYADREMRRICIADGMSRLRANYSYLAVRWFAAWAARPEGAL